jgi:ATP-dependent Clp protease adaptor protein ClpS
MTKEETKTLDDILAETGIEPASVHQLILLNDDVNSFEWVIYCLMQVLKFDSKKAEATAWKVHLQGKALLKVGSLEELEPIKGILETNGLTLSIEKN